MSRRFLVLALWCRAGLCQFPTYNMETIVGAEMPASIPALEWNFNYLLSNLSADAQGSVWFSEGVYYRKLTRDGKLTDVPTRPWESCIVLGKIYFDPVTSLAVSPDGRLHVSDPICNVIRKLLPDGSFEIVAGRLDPGPIGDGGPAKQATLADVKGICFDSAGNLYILEQSTISIRKVDTRGTITRFASLSAGPGARARGIAVNRRGDVFVSDAGTPFRIFKINSTGVVTEFASAPGLAFRIALDAAGNLYVDGGSGQPITRITPDGKTAVLPNTRNYAGGVAADSEGNVYFGDSQYSISSISPLGEVRRVAGTGKTALQAGVAKYSVLVNHRAAYNTPEIESILRPGSHGEVWIGTQTGLYLFDGLKSLGWMLRSATWTLAPDSTGNVYHTTLCDVWKLDSSRDGARVAVIPFDRSQNSWCPVSLAFDLQDNLYMGSRYAPQIRKLDRRTGELTMVAGAGAPGDSGDGGLATSAQFRYPAGIAVNRNGEIFVADPESHRVRRINAAGVISTLAGTGVSAPGDFEAAAAKTPLQNPTTVAADVLGNVYIGECTIGARIRIVDRLGTIRTIAGGPANLTAADGISSLDAKLGCPRNLVVTPAGVVYFVDNRAAIRRLNPEVTPFPRVAAGGALHGATFLPGAVAPGMLLTIFGSNMGANSIVSGTVAGGRLGLAAGSTYVLFDGVPAPIVYAGANQIAVFVPYSARPGKKISMVVVADMAETHPLELDVVEARPGIFTADASGKGQGAILNQDVSVNSPANPATAGTIAVLFATGAGQTTPAGVDGQIATGATLPRPVLPVWVSICGVPAEVRYAGAAPSAPAGVLQVNAQIPAACAGAGNAEVVLRVGNESSPPGVTIAVK